MFTRQELFDYFAIYTPEQVEAALRAIAKYDKSIDPLGEEFPYEITEQLEGAFDITEEVLSDDTTLTIADAKTAAVLEASQKYPEMDTRIFQELIYIVSERAISRAVTLRKVEDGIFDAASNQLDVESLEKLRDKNERLIRAYQLIGNDDERINKILEEYGVNSIAETQELIDAWERDLSEPEEEFDADAWLTELNAGGEEPKKSLNRMQSRILVKHLFSTARKAG